jgi:acyl carrier protein
MMMTRDDILTAIETVLTRHMAHPHMEGFGPEARLNEELYLDSVLMLQVFLNLELEFGLAMPEEAIAKQDVETVDDLVGLYLPKPAAPALPIPSFPLTGGTADEGVHGEAYYDIKVHCFVSCVSHGLKKRGLDQRPLYFAVWDAKFAVSDSHQLRYHADGVTQEFFRSWFERLYGVPVREWYDPALSKAENLAIMTDLVRTRGETGSVMVMLDMFHMPERENKFNQDPFPHYLMLEETDDPGIWFVDDPDFRWEGTMERAKIIHAIMQPTVGGGYVFDTAQARVPAPEDIAAFFENCLIADRNPIVDEVRAIVTAHLDDRDDLALSDLVLAVRELPVLTIRKYAYEHGFAFFWRALKLPAGEFEAWCEEIEALVQSLKSLHYACMKLGQTGDRAQAPAVFDALDEADRIELRLKAKLGEIFGAWRDRHCTQPVVPMRRVAV